MLADISLVIHRNGESPEPPQRKGFEFVSLQSNIWFKEAERAYILYEADSQIYDSGKMLMVVYRRNNDEQDATENRLLDYEAAPGRPPKESVIMKALLEAFPDPSLFYPTITQITLETVNGVLTSAVTEAMDDIVRYLPIPSHLSHITTVPITELRKIIGLDVDVDKVKWNGQTFAFKKMGVRLEGTLTELSTLDKLSNSPNIIDLEAIVVDEHNAVRGFLMPFMHAGDLETVLRKARRHLGISQDNDKLVLDWSIKHAWARQITQSVVDLHTIEAYNGDLKTDNVLIGPEGQAILIDFLPMGITTEFAAPEVLVKWEEEDDATLESVLTGPADIYSLGHILYALAVEDFRGVRVPVWREGLNVPSWYRDLIESCLHLDPSARPTAVEVLSTLQGGGTLV